MASRSPGAEYSDKLVISFGEANQNYMIEDRMPNNDLAVFIFRMGFIIENKRQWIFEMVTAHQTMPCLRMFAVVFFESP